MAKTIMLINKKGGVGKTSTAINLMAGLSGKGFSVLGLDLDHGQSNLTKFFGIDTSDQNTLLELINGTSTFEDTKRAVSAGDIIPIDGDFESVLNSLPIKSPARWMFCLKELLAPLGEIYDYIVIDCPPALNAIVTAAMVAADSLIVPIEAEYFAVNGLISLLKEPVRDIKKYYNPGLAVEGLLLVKYQPRRNLTKELEAALDVICEELGTHVLDARIRFTVDVPNSQIERKSIFDYKPAANVAQDYEDLILEVIGEKK